jgi:hypothetical protein
LVKLFELRFVFVTFSPFRDGPVDQSLKLNLLMFEILKFFLLLLNWFLKGIELFLNFEAVFPKAFYLGLVVIMFDNSFEVSDSSIGLLDLPDSCTLFFFLLSQSSFDFPDIIFIVFFPEVLNNC